MLYKNYFASRATDDAVPGQASTEGAGVTYQTFFTAMSLWAGLLLCVSNLLTLYYWPTEFQGVMGEESILELDVVRPVGAYNIAHAHSFTSLLATSMMCAGERERLTDGSGLRESVSE